MIARFNYSEKIIMIIIIYFICILKAIRYNFLLQVLTYEHG
jgi:hypothetical protein